MISPKIKAGCGVFTVFGLGFALGAFCLLLVIFKVVPLSEGWRSQRSKDFVARHFQRQLDLDDEQLARFRPLLDEALDRRWEMRRDYLLKDRQLLEDEYFPKLEEFLSDEQKEKAQKMLQRWREAQQFKVAPPEPESADH